jgi:type IV secretory pathway TraG/TraD family ATPase VirD4
MSLVVSAYAVKRIRYNQKLSELGVNKLESSIEKLEANRMKDVRIDKNNSTLIGYTRLKKPVYCSDSAKHIGIFGTTGAGKTTAIANYIESATVKGYGLLLVDGKGDTGNGSLLDITTEMCRKHKRPLHVINMNDPANSAKYNPFYNATETVIKDMIINMTDWSEEHYKSNAERYLQRLIKMMMLMDLPLCFNSIIQNMSTDNFEALSATLQKHGLITKDIHIENLELIKASGKISEQAAARFAKIAESEIGQIFDENGVDIYTALESGAVVLFILNPLLFPETSAVMGRLVIIDSKKAVSKLFNGGKRSFFIFDEAGSYASPVLIDLINKSRSAGVTCLIATQSLADLEAVAGESFKRQLIENVNNLIVMRQNTYSSAEECAKTIGTEEKMSMTYKMSDTESTGEGSARRVREFICHPDEIKSFKTGEAVFLSRDSGKCERIKIVKPY